jgi:predicted component of type VI protein secretion system
MNEQIVAAVVWRDEAVALGDDPSLDFSLHLKPVKKKTPGGFQWNGQTYLSLSAIARAYRRHKVEWSCVLRPKVPALARLDDRFARRR